MKRFLLFVFPHYYPEGGWSDFIGAFDSLYEAEAEVGSEKYRKDTTWDHSGWHVVDTDSMKIVKHGHLS